MSELNRITGWTAIAAVVVALAGAALCHCGGASPSPAAAQKAAQAVVTASADAWTLAATECLRAAGVTDAGVANPALAHECYQALQPVHDGIVASQAAVSVWDAAAQNDFPCLMANVGVGFNTVVKLFPSMPTAVADVAIAAARAGAACKADGG